MSVFNLLFVPLAHVSVWRVGEDIKGTVNTLREFVYVLYAFSRGTAYIRERCSQVG
jgi:hypothetical protein